MGAPHPGKLGAGARSCPRMSQVAPPALPRVGWGLPRAVPPPCLGTSLAGGRHESPHGAETPPRSRAGGGPGVSPPPGCGCGRAAGFTAGLPSRSTQPAPASTQPGPRAQPCPRAHPQGSSIPRVGGCTHPITPSPHSKRWVHPTGGAKGRRGPCEGPRPVWVPGGGSQRPPRPPTRPAPRPGGLRVPVPRGGHAHRGGGELEARAGGGGCRCSADAAGVRGVGDETPAACVSRPAPAAAECATKTTIAPQSPPPLHDTGDGDVSSVREMGTLNPLRAGWQTSAACLGESSGCHRSAAPWFGGTR